MRILILVVPLLLSGCSLLDWGPATTPPPTLPPGFDLDAVLVCEGVDRDACEVAAAAALADVAASGDGAELPTIESVTIRSDGSWEVCWDTGCQGAELASRLTDAA
jgi:hypothetical protein